MALGASIESILTHLLTSRSQLIALTVSTEVSQASKERFKRHIDEKFWHCTGVARQPVDPALTRTFVFELKKIAPFSDPKLHYNGEDNSFVVTFIDAQHNDQKYQQALDYALESTVKRRLICLRTANQDLALYPYSYLEKISQFKMTEITDFDIKKAEHPHNFRAQIF